MSMEESERLRFLGGVGLPPFFLIPLEVGSAFGYQYVEPVFNRLLGARVVKSCFHVF